MRKDLLIRLRKDIGHTSIYRMSLNTGIPYTTLYRIYVLDAGGNVRTWDKIENYYYKLDRGVRHESRTNL